MFACRIFRRREEAFHLNLALNSLSDLWLERAFCVGMRRIKRALSLKGTKDETLSEFAEQISFEVNGKDNGMANIKFYMFVFCRTGNIFNRFYLNKVSEWYGLGFFIHHLDKSIREFVSCHSIVCKHRSTYSFKVWIPKIEITHITAHINFNRAKNVAISRLDVSIIIKFSIQSVF